MVLCYILYAWLVNSSSKMKSGLIWLESHNNWFGILKSTGPMSFFKFTMFHIIVYRQPQKATSIKAFLYSFSQQLTFVDVLCIYIIPIQYFLPIFKWLKITANWWIINDPIFGPKSWPALYTPTVHFIKNTCTPAHYHADI